MDVETFTYEAEKNYNPQEILAPIAPFFPEEVDKTINHEVAHSFADPEKSTKGGNFGYSAEVIKLPNGLIIASWVAWYQPWGDREPEDRMEMAKAPGWNEMSDQDILVYEASRRQWYAKLKEIQNEISEENPVSVLEIIPGREKETEDEYKERVEIIIKFGQKLNMMSQKGELPPMNELIDIEFEEIYTRYRGLFEEVYMRAEEEYNWEKAIKDEEDEDENVPEEENYVTEEEKNIDSQFGIIYLSSDGTNNESEAYSTLPLAV